MAAIFNNEVYFTISDLEIMLNAVKDCGAENFDAEFSSIEDLSPTDTNLIKLGYNFYVTMSRKMLEQYRNDVLTKNNKNTESE